MNEQSKMNRCRFHCGNPLNATTIQHLCTKQDDKPIDECECETCPMYNSLYIEYPITVSKVVSEPIVHDSLYAGKIGKPVKVRVKDKTYLGVFWGELPQSLHISHNSETGVLTVGHITNPAMFVPELNRFVFGYESWWSFIESPEDFGEITDNDIENTWYVKLAKTLSNGRKET